MPSTGFAMLTAGVICVLWSIARVADCEIRLPVISAIVAARAMSWCASPQSQRGRGKFLSETPIVLASLVRSISGVMPSPQSPKPLALKHIKVIGAYSTIVFPILFRVTSIPQFLPCVVPPLAFTVTSKPRSPIITNSDAEAVYDEQITLRLSRLSIAPVFCSAKSVCPSAILFFGLRRMQHSVEPSIVVGISAEQSFTALSTEPPPLCRRSRITLSTSAVVDLNNRVVDDRR